MDKLRICNVWIGFEDNLIFFSHVSSWIIFFTSPGYSGKSIENLRHYFGKSLWIDLPLTYRFVYIWVNDKFGNSEPISFAHPRLKTTLTWMDIEPSLRVCAFAHCTWRTIETKYAWKPRVGFRSTNNPFSVCNSTEQVQFSAFFHLQNQKSQFSP